MATIIKVDTERSDSDPTKEYNIYVDNDTGEFSCNCHNWVTKRRFIGQDCKHIIRYKKKNSIPLVNDK
jgi:hypothetical protein